MNMSGFFKDAARCRVRRTSDRSGQAMVEYLVVFVLLLAVVAIFALCLYAVRQQSNRALDLVASEYP
jgi:Flp pilus assembly protein TadG